MSLRHNTLDLFLLQFLVQLPDPRLVFKTVHQALLVCVQKNLSGKINTISRTIDVKFSCISLSESKKFTHAAISFKLTTEFATQAVPRVSL